MIWDEWKKTLRCDRINVFISGAGVGEEQYKNELEEMFIHLLLVKSSEPVMDQTMDGQDYIRDLIDNYRITAQMVVIVLVGPETKKSRIVDWEIAAALTEKKDGVSGLFCILLPEFALTEGNEYDYDDLPPRLADNLKTGFAKLYTWSSICNDDTKIRQAVDQAILDRVDLKDKVDNTRPLME